MNNNKTYNWSCQDHAEVEFDLGRIFTCQQLEQLRRSFVFSRQQLGRGQDVIKELDGKILQTRVRVEILAMFGDPVT